MTTHLKLKAYGKINLALDVLRKREDGYHDVRMIMQTVGIYDQLELQAFIPKQFYAAQLLGLPYIHFHILRPPGFNVYAQPIYHALQIF